MKRKLIMCEFHGANHTDNNCCPLCPQVTYKPITEALNDGQGECKVCNFMGILDKHNRCKDCTGFLDDYESNYQEKRLDELPSIYSDDAPPYMQMRILWNKVNEIIKIINNL